MLKKILVLLLIYHSSNAEIITDGTLGQQINLSGPNFQITSDLGQQHGTNLFHSFQDFNLNNLENATFSGSNNINNVISRVTGGNPSNIDGLIHSTIPNADFYFLNPYGIIFGSNAKLDIQGSFHASTADYLRLGKNGRFDIRNPNDSLLTTAPVTAFGFLTDFPTSINIQTSKLYVPKNQTLSLIGGELNINGDLSLNDETDTFHPKYPLKLFAESGRINLASIASAGEVIHSETGPIINANKGKITINNAWIGVSGNQAGNIFIRAGDLKIFNSEFEADSIDKNSEMIDIQADNLILYGSEISTDTKGIGNGGKILIRVANNFFASGVSAIGRPSLIFSGTEGQINNAGDAGQIDIEARQINIIDGAKIGSSTFGSGNGGLINIKAFDKLTISGTIDGDFSNQIDKPTYILDKINIRIGGLFANSKSTNNNAGNSGEISIQAKNLNLINHSVITSSAANSGGGNIKIAIRDLIYLKESRITTTVRKGVGNGGDISVSNPTFLVLDNSRLAARADAGHGGNINIKSEQFVASTNSIINASSRLGIDGNVQIESPDVDMEGFIIALPDKVIDASNLMKTPCNQRLGENLSSFIVNSSEGSPNSPDDLLPSGPLLENLPIKVITTAENQFEKPAISNCKNFW